MSQTTATAPTTGERGTTTVATREVRGVNAAGGAVEPQASVR